MSRCIDCGNRLAEHHGHVCPRPRAPRDAVQPSADEQPEPRITPAMVRKLKARLTRAWPTASNVDDLHRVVDEWTKAENRRGEK